MNLVYAEPFSENRNIPGVFSKIWWSTQLKAMANPINLFLSSLCFKIDSRE